MARFHVVVTDQVFPSIEIERELLLREIDADLAVADGTPEGVAAVAGEADALLNTYMPIAADLVARLPRCRIIARYGIGIDNVDVAAANQAGITVTNVPDYSVEEVAVHTAALMLALLRRIPQAQAYLRGGSWGIEGLRPIHRVSGLTFGFVGFGRIARGAARIVEAMGARVVTHDPYLVASPDLPEILSLEELLAASDVVSVHAPSTPATRGLFNAARIAAMRPGSFLVNTSRGPLVDLEAVIGALRSGHLAGAALDVFDREPLDPARIEGVPNLIATPHMAYYSEESLQESQRKAATQIIKVLTGVAPDYAVKL
jgi:D-3-phosphoglycerate dehydrogenase